jgi:large subunit ribosomal protein L33
VRPDLAGAVEVWGCAREGQRVFSPVQPFTIMQEVVILECTEAKKEGKPVSRYLTKRNKKTVTERIEKKKYNPFLKRHTVHKEIK